MPDEKRSLRGDVTPVEGEQHSQEMDALAPYVALAREIKREVDLVASDDSAGVDSLVEALERIPARERKLVAQDIFDRLQPETQWSIVERVFGDTEIRDYLREARAQRLAAVETVGETRLAAEVARVDRRLDTRSVPPHVELTLGLFVEKDAHSAVSKGHDSDTCARLVRLRRVDSEEFQVLEDVFNPRGGYFVTRDYDEKTWRDERLDAHSIVRVGSATAEAAVTTFEPFLYPGGRVDFTSPNGMVQGRLHLGFVMLGDLDVFAG